VSGGRSADGGRGADSACGPDSAGGSIATHADLDRIAEILGPLATRGAPLGRRTTYRVGGEAAVLVEAATEEDLYRCHEALRAVSRPVPLVVVGKGSNLLVADSGFPGLAVVLGGGFESVEIDRTGLRATIGKGEPTAVSAGGAVGLQALARQTAGEGLAGFEWAVGVPGSIGGAVRMNAGGHGSQMADVVTGARIFDLATGSAAWHELRELGLGYRASALRARDVCVAACLSLRSDDPQACLRRVGEVVRWRRENQPGGLNGGSVFTNPEGDAAGRLVDVSGLKGLRLRSAQVSLKHANFFQADPDGAADDVRALIEEVRDEVRASQGVLLEPELKMVGFPGDELPLVVASGADTQDPGPLLEPHHQPELEIEREGKARR